MAESGARAPGVIKLLGEHAVVYGKLSVAVAISLYSSARVVKWKDGVFRIEAPEWAEGGLELAGKELESIYAEYESMPIDEFVQLQEKRMPWNLLPYAVIAARLTVKHDVNVLGRKAVVSSKIPSRKGCASSAASVTAFTVAMLRRGNAGLGDERVIDIARDGERVFHKNKNAGAIDVSTSYYGGCVCYSGVAGAKKELMNGRIGIIIIDTGPKAATSEMVGKVTEMYKKDRTGTEQILDRIDACSKDGLDALRSGDFTLLGSFMNEDHELLKKLGVSSSGLDDAVKAAIEAGALGAKLSGGGGGGIAIAISNKPKKLIDRLKEAGFNAYKTNISINGARDYLKK